MTVAMHLCRGNFAGAWVAEGGYDPIAELLFNGIDIQTYYLEYDSDRSGSFEPLRFMPKGKIAVLGLVTTKQGTLETKDELKRRIDAASKFVPLEQLALSPQCGFSSGIGGNAMSVEEEIAKLQARHRRVARGLGLGLELIEEGPHPPVAAATGPSLSQGRGWRARERAARGRLGPRRDRAACRPSIPGRRQPHDIDRPGIIRRAGIIGRRGAFADLDRAVPVTKRHVMRAGRGDLLVADEPGRARPDAAIRHRIVMAVRHGDTPARPPRRHDLERDHVAIVSMRAARDLQIEIWK